LILSLSHKSFNKWLRLEGNVGFFQDCKKRYNNSMIEVSRSNPKNKKDNLQYLIKELING
ncbi:MAG: hypothetical protein LBG13_02610, partial [Holosporales bacterium]|nr:hypothetical protein [Holosporales bacterium]